MEERDNRLPQSGELKTHAEVPSLRRLPHSLKSQQEEDPWKDLFGKPPPTEEEILRQTRKDLAAVRGIPYVNVDEHHKRIKAEKDMYMNVPLPPPIPQTPFGRIKSFIKHVLAR